MDSHEIKERTLLEPVNFSSLKFQEGERTVLWNNLFQPDRPLIFFLIYYKCPSICNTQLNSFFKAVNEYGLLPGKDFELAVLSFDYKETPELADKKKNAYLQEFEKAGKKPEFHFLTGTKENIQTVTDSLRFTYYWNEKENQWVHPTGAYVYSPDGKFYRKVGGAVFDPKTLYFTLAEIQPKILKNVFDRVKLYFSKYEQVTGDYKIHVDRIFNIVMPILLIVSGIVIFSKLFRIMRNKKFTP